MKHIVIQNIRFGFEPNSSSDSSSLIWVDEERRKKLKDIFNYCPNPLGGGAGPGNLFTLASKKAKAKYLSAIIEDHKYIPKSIKKKISVEDSIIDDNEISHPYISFPYGYGSDGNLYDKDFLMEFRDFLLQDGLVVIGESSHISFDHKLIKEGFKNFDIFYYVNWDDDSICRKDKKYNFWSVFNRRQGNKIRFRYLELEEVDGKHPFEISNVIDMGFFRSSIPEVVDIKITNYCKHNCSYCYQGSSIKGKHGDTKEIFKILKSLSKMQTFEVALGGGEPTEHPDFIEILKESKKLGLTPNFTTRSDAWINSKEFKDIWDNIGGMSFTIERPGQLKSFIKKLEFVINKIVNASYKGKRKDRIFYFNSSNYSIYRKVSCQIVLGTVSKSDFELIVKEAIKCGVRLILLAYKLVGRGDLFTPQDYDWWFDRLIDIKHDMRYDNMIIDIAADTKLSSEYLAMILKKGVPKYFLNTKEGIFSWYIDAVDYKMGPSSYCDIKSYSSLNLKDNDQKIYRNILNKFSSYCP